LRRRACCHPEGIVIDHTHARNLTGLAAAVVLALAVPALAQKPVSKGTIVVETFVIDAIDHASRMVTLSDGKGHKESVYCGPEVERFSALKVGDKVTFQYHESVVYQIRKPGSIGGPEVGTSVIRTPGDKPGGTMSQQVTATVLIDAIDIKAPSVTFTNADGTKSSFRVQDAKNLEGYKAGDRVQVTYTQALAISVK
jgi:hypothetical protein